MCPKISIIIPVYNTEKYLKETLQSVQKQDFSNWECVIVDDGSTDNSAKIAIEYCKHDSRFKYIYQVNKGLAAARNTGIKAAQGSYILPLDSDDLIASYYCSEAVHYLDAHPDTKLVNGKAKFFEKKHGEIKLGQYCYYNFLAQNFTYCSAVFRKSDWEIIGGYDELMSKGMEDWEFWIRLLNENDKVYKIPKFVFFYRIRKNSMMTGTRKDAKEIKQYLYSKHQTLYDKYYIKERLFLFWGINTNPEYFTKEDWKDVYKYRMVIPFNVIVEIAKQKPIKLFSFWRIVLLFFRKSVWALQGYPARSCYDFLKKK